MGAFALQSCVPPDPLDRWGEVEPDILADVEAVLSWDGICDLEDANTRAKVEAGARVFHAEAVACLVPDDLFDGGWERRLEDEKAALLPLLGKHYMLSRDPRLLGLGICDIHPVKRIRPEAELRSEEYRVAKQPFYYALALPDALEAGDARREFFACPEWSIERRLNHQD